MTSRQTGQKISQMYGRRTAGKRVARRKPPQKGEQRQLVQFFICGAIFVALVAVKLLLPEQPGWFAKASGLMEQSMDVTEVFSAVGRAVSGGEGAGGWDDVYRSVFHPDEELDTPAEPTAAKLPSKGEGRGPAVLRESSGWQTASPMEPSSGAEPAQDPSGEAQQPTAGGAEKPSAVREVKVPTAQEAGRTEATGLAYILYSGDNQPDNATLGQVVLGFDYCTPLKGTLTSNFGFREHPVEGEERFHYGIDIAAVTGTEIGCFAAGRVKAVGESSSYGNYLIVEHENGFASLYAHCSRILVSSGASVKMGQTIAEVGETGIATGPHLHFELHQGGEYLDPIYYVSLP